MDEINFEDYRDPFKAFNIHMSIVCDLEQGGKITEEEEMDEVPAIYKQFKFYYKHNIKPKLNSENQDVFNLITKPMTVEPRRASQFSFLELL